MKKLLLLLLIISGRVFGQSGDPLNVDYSPVSPEAAMLFKFSDIPVGYYTGIPNVNVPLYQIQEGDLNVPIGLSYHSGGSKVKQLATWIGLDWSLNGAGIITRELRGLPDDTDEGRGFLKLIENYSLGQILSQNAATKAILYEEFSSGCGESEPDMFYFSMGNGLRGKFMFDWNGNIRIESSRDIKIDYVRETGSYNIKEFTITDDFGIVYKFDQKESTTKEVTPRAGFCGLLNNTYVSGWKLSSIVNANATERVDFEYENFIIDHEREINQTYSLPLPNSCASGGGPNVSRQSVVYTTNGKRLKKIYTSNVTVEFNVDESNSRSDIQGTNLYPLDEVYVYNRNGKQVKKMKFIHDYSIGRLTLKQVNQISNNNEVLRLYDFEYHNGRLPEYNSYSTDHWGYYNGVNNQYPYPALPYKFPDDECLRYLAGGDKEPNQEASEVGILTKIVYPTGGYTTFDYENHDYSFIQNNELEEQKKIENKEVILHTFSSPENPSAISSTSFTIEGDPSAIEKNVITVKISGNTVTNFAGSVLAPKFKIVDENNVQVFSTPPIPYTEPGEFYYKEYEYCLSPGNYAAIVTAGYAFNVDRPNERNSIEARVGWGQETPETLSIRKAGGVRISKIEEFDVDGTPLKRKRFEYRLTSAPNKSSGAITAFPKYFDIGFYLSSVNTNGTVYQEVCQVLEQYSGSLSALGSAYGHVEYKEVNVYDGLGDKEHKTTYEYYSYENGTDIVSLEKPYPPITSRHFKRNLLKKETYYKRQGNTYLPVSISDYEYGYYDTFVPSLKVNYRISGIVVGGTALGLSRFAEARYDNLLGHNKLIKKTDRSVYTNGNVDQVETNIYENSLRRLAESTLALSETGEIQKRKLYYPDAEIGVSEHASMVTRNMTAIPIKQEAYRNDIKLSTTKTIFNDWGAFAIFPEFTQVGKGETDPDDRIQFHLYDTFGNPLEVSQPGAGHTVYVWGYGNEFLIAKIENVTYSMISSYIANLKNKSDADNDRCTSVGCTEQDLRNAQQDLRNALSGSMVTTYTYDPLIGITSITDPKGYTVYYEYDNFNRLKLTKDAEGNLISETKYHYKNQ